MKRRSTTSVRRARLAASAAFVLLAAAGFAQQPALTIDGRPYRRLETREATREALRRELTGVDVEWGPWRQLGPLELPEGSAGIARTLAPEAELPRLARDAPGPELSRRFVAKGGGEATWVELARDDTHGGADGFGTIDFRVGLDPALNDHAAMYLHRSLVARRPAKLRVNIGSDDGLRLWLNGRLLIDAPIERGFNPEEHVIALELERGTNHLLAKIAQDAGGWSFALAPDVALPRSSEAALEWQLELDFPEGEAKHWRVATIAAPDEASLEVGGLDLLPDGRPVFCTRRGEVFVVDGAYDLPATRTTLTRFASGLHEPLGIAVRPDERAKAGFALLVAQRGELTRLVDLDGDLRADLLETACDAWQISGNYHEYAFGPRYDAEGNAWVTLNLGHTGGETVMGAPVPTRGCCVRIRPDGTMEIAADGLRSPDGIGYVPGLGAFYTDNQGDYVGTNKLSPVPLGSFHGHQASLPFRAGWKKGDPVPPRQEPAIWFPYGKMGQSASDLVQDATQGRFGPYAGQLFVGDQTHASIMRVSLERVGDAIQGCCYPFRSGLASGVHRLAFAPDGSLLAGLTDRGWGSRGARRDGLQRLLWTGVTPFEALQVTATSTGFDVEFTRDVDPATAAALASWRVTSWTYKYHPDYGSPEIERAEQPVVAAELVQPRRVRLTIERLRPGFVHELQYGAVRSREGDAPLHDSAWYTLQRIPAAE